MFKLLRYYALLSALPIILVSAAALYFYRADAIDQLVRSTETQNVAVTQAMANAIWPRFSDYIKSVTDTDGDTLRAHPETRALHEDLSRLAGSLPVLKMKIYNLEGITLYSSEAAQIGDQKGDNPSFVAAAREGRFVSKLSHRDRFMSFTGPVPDRDVIETYVCIKTAGSPIEAVFEIYSDVTPQMRQIEKRVTRLGFAVLIFASVFYLLLFLIVRYADGIITRQYRRLETAEQELKDFAEISSDWFWRMDEKLRFSYFSDQFYEITGVPPERLLGKTREQTRIPDVDPEAWERQLADLASHRPFRSFIHPRTLANGEVVWLSINGTPVFDKAGVFKGYRGTGSDITDLKRAQEQAELANRAKSDFLACMSHEIRTPLNGMLGMAELLSNTSLEGQQQRWVGAIRRSGNLLRAIVSDLLDFSRIEAGRLELEDETFDLGQLLSDLDALFRDRAAAKGVALIWNSSLPPTPVFRGDQGRLGQVLINLIGNAIKFTEDGKVQVSVSRDDSDRGEPRLRFLVADEGIGIDSDKQERIFEAFTQADGSMTRRFGGTGLGLAICRQLVHLMGGEIGVESTRGTGSTFWFTVAVSEASVDDLALQDGIAVMEPGLLSDQVAAQEVPADLGLPLDADILLVEDNVINQDVACAMLESLGCRVDMVGDGRQAVIASSSQHYDAILLDCEMPVMDGFEAARQIRQKERDAGKDKRVPIIAQTANAFAEDRKRCLAAGMDDYISKPFSRGRLRQVLAEWIPVNDADPDRKSEPERSKAG